MWLKNTVILFNIYSYEEINLEIFKAKKKKWKLNQNFEVPS